MRKAEGRQQSASASDARIVPQCPPSPQNDFPSYARRQEERRPRVGPWRGGHRRLQIAILCLSWQRNPREPGKLSLWRGLALCALKWLEPQMSDSEEEEIRSCSARCLRCKWSGGPPGRKSMGGKATKSTLHGAIGSYITLCPRPGRGAWIMRCLKRRDKDPVSRIGRVVGLVRQDEEVRRRCFCPDP